MAYLFDTDAISEFMRPRPRPAYLAWAATVAQDEQFTSALVVAELYKGAFRSPRRGQLVRTLEDTIIPRFTVLDFGSAVARDYGRIRAEMESGGVVVAEMDLLIASTAIHFGLRVVTGNVAHFERVPGIQIERVLAEARPGGE